MAVGLVANAPGNSHMIKQKDAKTLGSHLFNAYEGAKDAAISIKVTKGSSQVAENFVEIPTVLSAIFRYVKVIKICAGIVALGSLYSNVKKLIWSEGIGVKAFASYRIYSSAKKITRAVSIVMSYARDFGLIASNALKWTLITDYIFLPVKFLAAGISSYEFGYKFGIYRDIASCVSSTDIKRSLACISDLEPELRRMEIITDECPLKERCDAILERLTTANEVMYEKAVNDGKRILYQLQDRVSAQVIANGIDVATRATALAIFLIGFTNPISALPAAIIGLGLTVLGYGNLAYSRFIPTGDFIKDERSTLYAATFNVLHAAYAFGASTPEKIQTIFLNCQKEK